MPRRSVWGVSVGAKTKSAFGVEARGFAMPPPPAETSTTTFDEMVQIGRMVGDLTNAQIFRIRHEDRIDVETLFVEVLEQYGFQVGPKILKRLAAIREEVFGVAEQYQGRFQRMTPRQWRVKHGRKTPLPPCQTEPTYAYPSKHATVGAFLARYLGEKFPRAKPTLDEYGRQVGWNRVRAGWHWASDYAMGRQLAEHLWKHFDEKGLT